MAQHFLLSARARGLSLATVARLTEEEAYDAFKSVRWADADGEPTCPRCGGLDAYGYRSRRVFKCRHCSAQFSVTSGTIFAGRKLSYRDLLFAIAAFVAGAKGLSALQMSRDLGVQYKTAFVLAHKIREAMASESRDARLAGKVEVDGAYFGGHVRPENRKADRKDLRLKENQSGKRRVVVVARERDGVAVTSVHRAEGEGVPVVVGRVEPGSTIYADESTAWDGLHAHYDAERINHSESYAEGDASTNWAESYFSRLRRAEIGVHHRISGEYLHHYAAEMAWRENRRRRSNGWQIGAVTSLAMQHAPSKAWKGYWQRSQKRREAA